MGGLALALYCSTVMKILLNWCYISKTTTGQFLFAYASSISIKKICDRNIPIYYGVVIVISWNLYLLNGHMMPVRQAYILVTHRK